MIYIQYKWNYIQYKSYTNQIIFHIHAITFNIQTITFILHYTMKHSSNPSGTTTITPGRGILVQKVLYNQAQARRHRRRNRKRIKENLGRARNYIYYYGGNRGSRGGGEIIFLNHLLRNGTVRLTHDKQFQTHFLKFSMNIKPALRLLWQ